MPPLPRKIKAALAPESYRTSGKTNYNYEEALAEFIDNSISARTSDVQLKVNVKVFIHDNVAKRIEICDNGRGIPEEAIESVIALGKTHGQGDFNEHGMGLKQAAWWIGDRHSITTTTNESPHILQFSPLNHETEVTYIEKPDGMTSFTELSIDIRDGSTFIPQETRAYRNLILQLGARYRRFLHTPNGSVPALLLLNYETYSKEGNEAEFILSRSERVLPVFPQYYKAGQDQPYLNKKRVKAGDGSWEIELTLGLAPTNEQHDTLGTPTENRPTLGHPYYVGISKQGLDLMIKGRVLQFHQLSEIGLVGQRHNSFNLIRGEINLLSGFKTQRTKNGLMTDSAHWPQMIQKVASIMKGDDPEIKIGRNLLEKKLTDDEVPDIDEIIYQRRIANMLRRVPVMNHAKHDVNVEVQLGQGIDVRADIVVGDTIWEIKKGESGPMDLMQLVMYLTITGQKKGILVAQSFKQTTRSLLTMLNEKLNLQLMLQTHADLSIASQVTPEELEWHKNGGFSNKWNPKVEF